MLWAHPWGPGGSSRFRGGTPRGTADIGAGAAPGKPWSPDGCCLSAGAIAPTYRRGCPRRGGRPRPMGAHRAGGRAGMRVAVDAPVGSLLGFAAGSARGLLLLPPECSRGRAPICVRRVGTARFARSRLRRACHRADARARVTHVARRNPTAGRGSNGATANMVDRKGQAALHYAAAGNHADVLQSLLAHGADLELADSNGNTALMVACKGGAAVAAGVLLNAAANVNGANRMHKTALMCAAEAGSAVRRIGAGRRPWRRVGVGVGGLSPSISCSFSSLCVGVNPWGVFWPLSSPSLFVLVVAFCHLLPC